MVHTLSQLPHVSGCALLPSWPGTVYLGVTGTCPLLDGVPGALGGWRGAGYAGHILLSSLSWGALKGLSTSASPLSCSAWEGAGGRAPVGGGGDLGELARSWYSLFLAHFDEQP